MQDAQITTDATTADATNDATPDVFVPPVFSCAAVAANLCDDYERGNGLIAPRR